MNFLLLPIFILFSLSYQLWKYKMRLLIVLAILFFGYFWFNRDKPEPTGCPAEAAQQIKETGVVHDISTWLRENTPKQ